MKSAVYLVEAGCDWSRCNEKDEIINRLELHLRDHGSDYLPNSGITIDIHCSSSSHWCIEIEKSMTSYTKKDFPVFAVHGCDIAKLESSMTDNRGYVLFAKVLNVRLGACK